MDSKLKQAATFSERKINNEQPINWDHWVSIKTITPLQAAQLSLYINPDAENPNINELSIKLKERERQLNLIENKNWSLTALVSFLIEQGEDVPYLMKSIINESRNVSAVIPKEKEVTPRDKDRTEDYRRYCFEQKIEPEHPNMKLKDIKKALLNRDIQKKTKIWGTPTRNGFDGWHKKVKLIKGERGRQKKS